MVHFKRLLSVANESINNFQLTRKFRITIFEEIPNYFVFNAKQCFNNSKILPFILPHPVPLSVQEKLTIISTYY